MSQTKKAQITPEGLKQLKEELEYRKNTKKKELSDVLAVATEKGDLSENDEYDIALEETLVNDARIAELTELIKNAEIVENNDCNEKVQLGCKVRVKLTNGNEKVIHLVGETEANPVEQKISITSPIGQGLLNKSVGEEVSIDTPRGTTTYTIVAIE